MSDQKSDSLQTLLRALLILRGAISVHDEIMPEICRTLIAAQKKNLYYSLDYIAEALYRLQDELEAEWLSLRES